MPAKSALWKIPPVIWIIALLCVLYGLFAPGFFTFRNLQNIIVQASPLLIVALGMTMVILTEGIDLSVGLTMGVIGVFCAFLMKTGYPMGLAVLLGLSAGTFFVFLNGLLVSTAKLPPFIATLGLGSMVFGFGLVLTGGESVPISNSAFRFLHDGTIIGLPMPIFLAVVVFGFAWILMYHTPFGRNVIALGGNPEALRVAGVNIERAQTLVYTLAGFLAGITGIIIAARTASGYAAATYDWEFDAIGATIIGGTSFEEGQGGIGKTILGVLLISVLRNGLNVAGVSNKYQFAFIGLVVLVAIIIDVKFRQATEGGAEA
ncbi:MAG: ABC transporter permease [Firmicutes bacterium]|nr:ABC transporter permease [Bacillota bacterium]